MDPIKLREAFGLPPDAPAAELEAAMAADPDLITMSGGAEAAAALAALYGAEPAPEPTRGPWLVLESGEVARVALELLELWIMTSPTNADFEMTKITAMEQLSGMTRHDLMRVASATAGLAVQVLTNGRDRERVSERLQLEIAMLMESHGES
jgi:hypothetical protein